jgi:branched-chain amino acid aminotransferase
VTNKVLQVVAADSGFEVQRRPVPFSEVSSFKEVGACGTAVVLTPIGSITKSGDRIEFGGCETLLGLRQKIVDIQCGAAEDKYGWLVDL